MKILQLDKNHPLIAKQLQDKGFVVDNDYESSYNDVLAKINNYDGIIIRSRIPLDENFLNNAPGLKFIARVGAGMENIAVETAEKLGVSLINSPEGNRDAVAEHVLGMLLMLLHKLSVATTEVKEGIWKREENRGDELFGKTVGLIGYGNMGKATAKRLSGFGCKVIFYDIINGLQDEFAQQVSLQQLQKDADIISLHIPITDKTYHLIDENFINLMEKNFYLVNTARGKNIQTDAVVSALKSGKIKGVCLDVLEYENSSFEQIENNNLSLDYLLSSDKAIVTPHIAGWTIQSKENLAQIIVNKIIEKFA
ncbi:MAG: hydroxyacid dehydrogenase [Bacteroidetes bacterium]|nr:hydroxyacid dehydrogenase [Bacteroidota bacterium]